MPVLIAKDAVREPLYIIVPLSNPWRWKSRWKHVERTIKHFMDAGAVVYLVEVAFNRRDFVFADSGLDGTPANCGILGSDHRFRHKYIGLRSPSELWLKEAQINVGVQNLPYDWQQVAWCDADIHFLRPNFVGETIHLLQHYAFLQMFTHARDLDPEYELLPEDYPHAAGSGFVHYHQQQAFEAHVQGTLTQSVQGDRLAISLKVETDQIPYPPPRVWPGLAWSCTRQAWDAVGGLMDFHIWGGADWVSGHALIGKSDKMMRDDLHPNYKALTMEWFDRCERHIRRNVGVMRGSVAHYWHGRKVDRAYNPKHRLLAQIGFDPLRHLKRDSQNLWQLNDDGSDSFIELRDGLRDIARYRNEDTNDTRMDLSPELWWK